MSTVCWGHMPGRTAAKKAEMARFLGIDTSNYTTSAALYDTERCQIYQAKRLLPVKPGEAGLRQSDAVFHHTRQLPQIMDELFSKTPPMFDAIGVSVWPRNGEESYMPCFLCGEGVGSILAGTHRVPLYQTSHQIGHILAVLYSANAMHLLQAPFLAFHVSGGTTDCVLCTPDPAQCLRIEPVSTSLDLKAGQAVDRVGLMLGLQFPCGPTLEQLAMQCDRLPTHPRPVMKGLNCCLSGLQNQCQHLLDQGTPAPQIALYCLMAIAETVYAMTKAAFGVYGQLPVVYAGGVMSNQLIRREICRHGTAYFAAPAFSCDNAAGVAVYAALSAEEGKQP